MSIKELNTITSIIRGYFLKEILGNDLFFCVTGTNLKGAKEMDETTTKFSYKALKEKKKKFVRYKEGAELYSMGLTKFQEIARESGAVYKIGNLCLVKTEILDDYLEAFRMDPRYGFYK